MCVKTEIVQNDTDLSCIKNDINVSKCFTKAQPFETGPGEHARLLYVSSDCKLTL